MQDDNDPRHTDKAATAWWHEAYVAFKGAASVIVGISGKCSIGMKKNSWLVNFKENILINLFNFIFFCYVEAVINSTNHLEIVTKWGPGLGLTLWYLITSLKLLNKADVQCTCVTVSLILEQHTAKGEMVLWGPERWRSQTSIYPKRHSLITQGRVTTHWGNPGICVKTE